MNKKVTNVEMLKEKINSSGYKVRYIAEKLKITNQGLYKKLNGDSEFKASEIKILKQLLNLTDEERDIIFFA